MRIIITSALLVGATAGIAHANGYAANEQDAEVIGRGFAAAASDTDPSAIFYNIGGLAVADGTAAQLGASLVFASENYTPTGGSKQTTTNGPLPLPHVYISSRVHDLVSIGVGFYVPYGADVDWPNNSPTDNVVQHLELITYYISPSIGLNLHEYVPGLTLGGGIDLVPATVELRNAFYFGTDRGSANLGGTAFGVGARAGAMYRPPQVPQLSLGVMWHTTVREKFSGNGDFDSPPQYRSELPPDGTVNTVVKMPAGVSGGVAYNPIPDLQLEADVSWVAWSRFETLKIELPGGSGEQVFNENFQNETSFRFGAEYALAHGKAAIRAGFVYDPTPVSAANLTVQLPDADRRDFTLGGTYHINDQYKASLGLLYVIPNTRTTTNAADPGEIGINAFVASLTLSGRLGK